MERRRSAWVDGLGRHGLAVVAIAFLATAAQELVEVALGKRAGDVRAINVAGRQRMLSQRLGKAALALATLDSAEARRHAAAELQATLTVWERQHRGLLGADPDLPGPVSPELQGLFARIEPHRRALVSASGTLLATASRAPAGERIASEAVTQMLAHEAAYLELMERIVAVYEDEALARRRRLVRAGWILLALLLLALLRQVFAERALRASERRFFTAFHASPQPMSITRMRDERLLEVNESFLRAAGYERDEVVGLTTLELGLWSESGDRVRLFEELEQRGRVRDREVLVRRKDGSEAATLFSIAKIDLDGQPCALTTIQDITARRRAELALRASETRYRHVSELTSDFAYAMTLRPGHKARWDWVTDAFTQITGFSAEQLDPRRAYVRLIVPEDRRTARRHVRALLAGQVDVCELRIRTRSGDVRWLRHHARPLATSGPDAEVQLYGAAADISEEKRRAQEQASLHAEVRELALDWSSTFDAVRTPILSLGCEGQINRINRAALDVAGKLRGEVEGRNVAAIVPGEPWQSIAGLVPIACQQRAATLEVRDTSGVRVWQLAADHVPGSAEERERVIVVAWDLTETVRLQEALRRSETLAAMGALVAGVAHEVRNPLFCMTALLDAFESTGVDSSELPAMTLRLRAELDRMARLVNDLLQYGRPSPGDRRTASVETMLADAADACRWVTNEKKVRVVTRAAEDVWLHVDSARVTLALRNLLENAVQHSPTGGTVLLEIDELLEGESRWVRCTVKDEGPGIPEPDVARLFEPFFTRRHGGTGLGLSIVQRVAEEHGGSVVAGNRPDGGAAMSLLLPRPPTVTSASPADS